VTPVKGGDEVATASYMKINFVMPGNATTRAADQGFEFGTDAENAVNSGVLFFFDGTTQVADPFDLSNLNWNAQTSGTIEKKSDIVVVLENPLRNPTSVVAVLNATMSELGLSKSSTLDDIKAVLKDFSKTTVGEGDEAKPNFVMSSSAYDGAVNDVAAAIPADKIFKTRDEALGEKAPSVKVPVERVVAKVEVAEKSGGATQDLPTIKIDGKDVKIVAEIKGFWLDNAAKTSLLLKDISDNASSGVPSVNDATNMRSYWAKSAATDWAHGKYTENTDAKYVQENTNTANPTQVVVAATLKAGADGAALPLVTYLGKLYTETGFATEAINVLAHKYYVLDGTEYKTVSDADIVVTYEKTAPEGTTLKSYEAYAKLAKKTASATFYVKDASAETGYRAAKDAEVTADLKGYVVQRWEEGATYYYVPIEHVAKTKLGVIRNHVYKLTVNSITGLGTPVPFKDVDEIIPEIPVETETYISAEIDILAWKLVEQGVDLGK